MYIVLHKRTQHKIKGPACKISSVGLKLYSYIFCLWQTRYIVDELKDKSNLEVDPSSWVVVSESLPLQQNG